LRQAYAYVTNLYYMLVCRSSDAVFLYGVVLSHWITVFLLFTIVAHYVEHLLFVSERALSVGTAPLPSEGHWSAAPSLLRVCQKG